MDVILSDHAIWRCAQRNVSYDEVIFICEYGERLHNAGVIFCQLRDDRMPASISANHPYQRLTGATVVLCRCGCFVITVYREEEAFHADKKKSKYSWQQAVTCPHCAQQKTHKCRSKAFYDTSLVQ